MSMPTFRKSNLMFILGGVLFGMAGTALVMSRSRPAPPSQAQPRSDQQTTQAAENTETERGRVTLTAEAIKSAGIRVASPRIAPVGESLIVPGVVALSPNRGAKVTPPTAGKVIRLLVNLGDRVSTGQPLLVLDSYEVAQARAALRQAEANVQQMRAALQTAQADASQVRAGIGQAQADVQQARTRQAGAETALQRQRELAAAGAFSQAPLQAAQSELSTAQSELLTAQNDLQAHTVSLQRTERLFKEELVSRSELEQAQLQQHQDQTRVQQAQSRVGLAKQALEREQKVFRGDLLSKQAIQTAEAEVRTAQGDVQKVRQSLFRAQEDAHRAERVVQAARTALLGAESGLNASRANLVALAGASQNEAGGLLTIYAPLAGTVTERNATTGESVERSAALCVIENLNAVMVIANVAESDVAHIRIGQHVDVTVSGYHDMKFPGVIQSVAGRVDEKTRALAVRCLVENPGGRLKPEMFAQVRLATGAPRRVLSVPESALVEDGGQQSVFVLESGGYEKRIVTIGQKFGGQVEIVNGITPSDKVVVEGAFILKSEVRKGQLKEGD